MNSPSAILPDDDTEKIHSSKLNKAYSVKGDVSLSHIYNATHTKTCLPCSFFPKKSQILSVRFSGVFSSSGRFFWSSLEIILNMDCKEEQRHCTYSDESTYYKCWPVTDYMESGLLPSFLKHSTTYLHLESPPVLLELHTQAIFNLKVVRIHDVICVIQWITLLQFPSCNQ